MIRHLIWEADVADFAAWRAVFGKEEHTRHAAGLSTLHVWTDPERPNHAVVLFEVRDLDRARAFLCSEEYDMQVERDGVVHMTTRDLVPA